MKKLLKILLYIIGGIFALLILLTLGAVIYIDNCIHINPPEIKNRGTITTTPMITNSEIVHLGKSWMRTDRGIKEIYVEGSPYEIGYATARLTADEMTVQEEALMQSGEEFIPSKISQFFILRFMKVLSSYVQEHITQEYQEEYVGLAEGYPDKYPQYGDLFTRMIVYHTVHDFGHLLIDTSIIESRDAETACSAFAVKNEYTIDGSLIAGRNFDFDIDDMFDNNKVIYYVKPDKGNSFVSVSWGGMAGVISGVNSQKIWISVNGARSKDLKFYGTPMSMVLREVLQYSSSIKEAVAIIKKRDVFISDMYLLLDGKTKEIACVENTPTTTVVNQISNSSFFMANHFISETMKNDPANITQMKEGTTVARAARLNELLNRYKGDIDSRKSAMILRDMKGEKDADLGIGNRNTINALIAGHGVVYSAKKNIIWVSRAPHLVNEFIAVNINDLFKGKTSTKRRNNIPATAFYKNGQYEKFRSFNRKLSEIKKILRGNNELKMSTVYQKLLICQKLNPNYFELYEVFGDYYSKIGNNQLAVKNYTKSLTLYPHYLEIRQRINKKLSASKLAIENEI